MMSFIVALALYFVLVSLGRWGCRTALHLTFDAALDALVFSAAIGLGGLIYLTLVFGLAGLLYPAVIRGVASLLFVLAVVCGRGVIRQAHNGLLVVLRGLQKRNGHAWALIGLSVFVLIHLFRALAPVTEWDSVYYHLAAPQIYIHHHQLLHIPFMPYVNHAFGMEMVHTFALLLWNDTLTQLIPVFTSVILVLTIIAIGRRYVSTNVGLLAGLVFYTIPWILYYVPFPKPDISLTMFATLAVYAWLRWRETRDTPWLLLSALLAGFTGACKITGGAIGLILLLFLVVDALFVRPRHVISFRPFVLFLVMFVVLLLPWYVKAYVWTGNPVWPELYGMFGGKGWSPEAAAGFHQEVRGDYAGDGYGVLTFLRTPFDLTFSFGTGVITPLFLAFLPGLVIFRPLPKPLKWLAGYAGFYFLIWFFLTRQVRFLFPAFPALSLLTAYSIISFEQQRSYRRLIHSVVAVFIGFALFYVLSLTIYVAAGVLGVETRETYLHKRAWMYEEAVYVNEHLPLTSKVGIFFGAGYYFEREYLYLWPFYQAIVNVAPMTSASELLHRFQEIGLTHLIWQNPTSQRYHFVDDDPLFMKWQTFVERLRDDGHLREVFRGKEGIVYEIILPQRNYSRV